MRTLTMCLWLASIALGTTACHDDEDAPPRPSDHAGPPKVVAARVEQIKPPLDLQTPPGDAAKTSSGLIYKTLVANRAGAQAKRTETVLIQYTGWIQRTGVTFFSTRGRGQPIAIDLAHSAPSFAEALPLLHKGEKAVMWTPASAGTNDTLVYEVELIDIVSPPVLATRVDAETGARSTAAH